MRTTEEIYQALLADFTADSGAAAAEGGDLSLRLRAVAAEMFSLEAQADFVARQSFPQTAVGEYLNRHAEVRGLQRGAAGTATGALRFTVTAAAAQDIPIPAGTECLTAAGTAFRTTEAGNIAAGTTYCSVAAEAAAPGSGGNVAAGTVTYFRLAPTGVAAVTNPAPFSGGTDGETDEALRERILRSYRLLPNGANAAYYESKVQNVEGVEAVTVLPKNRGIGTVDVIFSVHSGIPSAAEITAVQALLDSEREICVDIDVLAPTAATVNVTAAVTVAEGYTAAAVITAAQAAVQGYFSGKLLSRPVYRAQLLALLMAVDGVQNCTLTAPAADVAAAAGVLPQLGTLAISEAV